VTAPAWEIPEVEQQSINVIMAAVERLGVPAREELITRLRAALCMYCGAGDPDCCCRRDE
jgi:hypothetical protein